MTKFKNIPHIFYIDFGNSTYVERNLKNLGILNFTKVLLQENLSITYINLIKKWIEETKDNTMIIMPDHVDFEYVKYFYSDWSWDYLIDNLPHDWDSILLGFEDKLEVLPCFLHPIRDSHGSGMTLLNRRYANKLLNLHKNHNFTHKISNAFWKRNQIPEHYFLNHCGKCYAVPLFPRNPELVADKEFNLYNNKKLYSTWWMKYSKSSTIEQFHLYHSDKDFYLNFKKL